MIFYLVAGGIAVLTLGGSLLLLKYGRRLGQRYLNQQGTGSLAGLNVVEGAVFALMGLLIAFSISGALQRFDDRRALILQEAIVLATAADRIELMDLSARDRLREKLMAYIEARVVFYREKMSISLANIRASLPTERLRETKTRWQVLWSEAASQCPFGISNTGCALLLPALNAASEAAMLRHGAIERHPPMIVFIMLFALALASSLLAGFSMAVAKTGSYVHAVVFATAISLLLYVILDIEFPRVGLIRVDQFDHHLEDVLETVRQQSRTVR
jgi:hypothetical protein